MKRIISKYIRVSHLSVILILASVSAYSPLALSKTNPICITELALLDPDLHSVLDQFSDLLYSLRQSDSQSSMGVILKEKVARVASLLQRTIVDKPTREAARKYVQEHLTQLEAAFQTKTEEELLAENEARKAEHHRFLTQFEPSTDLEHIPYTMGITAQGETFDVDTDDEENIRARISDSLILGNLSNPRQKHFKLSTGIPEALSVHYFRESGHVWVVSRRGLYSIELPKILTEGLILKTTVAFNLNRADTSGDLKKFNQALKISGKAMSAASEPLRDLESSRLSQEGEVFAARYDDKIVLFLTKSHKFISLKISRQNLEAGAWALSPDGKYIAIAGQEVSIFETSEGRYIKNIPIPSTAVTFSPDNRSIIADAQGRNRLLMQNFLDDSKEPQQEYLTESLPNVGNKIINFIYMTSDGEKVISSTGNRQITVWDATSSHPQQKLNAPHERLRVIDGGQSFISVQDYPRPSKLWERK